MNLIILTYNNLPYKVIIHKTTLINTINTNFILINTNNTTIKTTKPLINIYTTHTNYKKSQTTHTIIKTLKTHSLNIISIHHPIPYDNLIKQKIQHFTKLSDLKKHKYTIKKIKKYKPHIQINNIIYANMNYKTIIHKTKKKANIII